MARHKWSFFARLIWLPVLAAPLRYVFPRMLLPALLIGGAMAAIRGMRAGLGLALCVWFVAGWIVTFTCSDDGQRN